MIDKWFRLAFVLAVSSCAQESTVDRRTPEAELAKSASGSSQSTVLQGYVNSPFGLAKVSYTPAADGQLLVEGDILFTKEQIASESDKERLGAFGRAYSNLWPNKYIPYVYDASVSSQVQGLFNTATAEWLPAGEIRWAPHRGQANYVVVKVDPALGADGRSAIGMRGGRQEIVLGPNVNLRTVLHEMGHAIGLWHEFTRPDRDQYVTVNWANVMQEHAHNFNLLQGSERPVTPFDYNSIMMYSSYSYSSNGKPTMTKRDGSQFGFPQTLSALDGAGVKVLYQAPVLPPAPEKKLPPQASDLSDQFVNALNPGSGMCLNPRGGAHADFTPIVLEPCDKSSNQKYRWDWDTIVHVASGKCVDVRANDHSDMTPLILYACNGSAAQRFDHRETRLLVHKDSGKCLDRQGARRDPGTPVVLYGCHGQENQVFTFYK